MQRKYQKRKKQVQQIISKSLFLICVMLFACSVKEKRETNNNVTSFFEKKHWTFPLMLSYDSVEIKYYLTQNIERYEHINEFENGVLCLNKIYAKRDTLINLLHTILLSNTKTHEGYYIYHPEILIDTIEEGNLKNPKFLIGLFVDRYTLNPKENPIPCEGCSFADENRLQKKTMWLVLEPDCNKEALYFKRWND